MAQGRKQPQFPHVFTTSSWSSVWTIITITEQQKSNHTTSTIANLSIMISCGVVFFQLLFSTFADFWVVFELIPLSFILPILCIISIPIIILIIPFAFEEIGDPPCRTWKNYHLLNHWFPNVASIHRRLPFLGPLALCTSVSDSSQETTGSICRRTSRLDWVSYK